MPLVGWSHSIFWQEHEAPPPPEIIVSRTAVGLGLTMIFSILLPFLILPVMVRDFMLHLRM